MQRIRTWLGQQIQLVKEGKNCLLGDVLGANAILLVMVILILGMNPVMDFMGNLLERSGHKQEIINILFGVGLVLVWNLGIISIWRSGRVWKKPEDKG